MPIIFPYSANSDKQILQLNITFDIDTNGVVRVIEGKLDTVKMFFASFFRQIQDFNGHAVIISLPFSFLKFSMTTLLQLCTRLANINKIILKKGTLSWWG